MAGGNAERQTRHAALVERSRHPGTRSPGLLVVAFGLGIGFGFHTRSRQKFSELREIPLWKEQNLDLLF